MRRCLHLAVVLALVFAGCDAIWQEPDRPETPCDEAEVLLLECGAQVALFERAECAGPARFAAECVLEHGAACEDLATLSEACARVVADAIGGIDAPRLPGDACEPPVALAPGVTFSVDGRVHRVEGLAYCRCTDAPAAVDRELCAPPSALVPSGACASPCEGEPV